MNKKITLLSLMIPSIAFSGGLSPIPEHATLSYAQDGSLIVFPEIPVTYPQEVYEILEDPRLSYAVTLFCPTELSEKDFIMSLGRAAQIVNPYEAHTYTQIIRFMATDMTTVKDRRFLRNVLLISELIEPIDTFLEDNDKRESIKSHCKKSESLTNYLYNICLIAISQNDDNRYKVPEILDLISKFSRQPKEDLKVYTSKILDVLMVLEAYKSVPEQKNKSKIEYYNLTGELLTDDDDGE